MTALHDGLAQSLSIFTGLLLEDSLTFEVMGPHGEPVPKVCAVRMLQISAVRVAG